MRRLLEWASRLRGSVHASRPDVDLEEEFRAHLDLAIEDARRRSGSGAGAARAAALRVGGVAQTLDSVRDQRGWPWIDDVLRDVRLGLRSLRRDPTFAAVSLLTLAIGIGAATAVFTVVDSVLVKPLAYPHPEELVSVRHSAPGAPGLMSVSGELRLSPSMFFTYTDHNQTFGQLGLWFAGSATVTGLAEPEQVRTLLVTNGTLQALAVQPALGRWLAQADHSPGAPQTAMLGHGYWQRRFGGDRSVVGRVITVDSRVREIVGVMPHGFRVVHEDPEVILPLAFDRSRLILPPFGFQAVARLKPGVTLADATADVARMVPIWMDSWPAARGINPRIYESWQITPALQPLKQDVVGDVARVLWVLMGTIGIVLVIACANVANLLLVRAEGRHQELAVRAALGAGRRRIVRALLVESVLLGLLGGALGVGVAAIGLRGLVALGPVNLPRLTEIAIDPRALGFALGVSLMSGLLFGLLPALKYAGPRIAEGLHAGLRTASQSKARHRARNLLVVAQVALALVLLVSSGLMIRTSLALRTVDPGFANPERIQTLRISIPATLVPEPAGVARTQHNIADRLAAIPGVAAVGFASAMHMEGNVPSWDAIRTEGQPDVGADLPPMRLFKSVSPDFFRTTGTRVVAGREYTWVDLYDGRPVVMVSENLARELWDTPPGALGKRIRTLLDGATWREVIGVVQDVRDNGVHEPAPAIVYWPSLGESPSIAGQPTVARTVTFAIRSERAGMEPFLSEVRQAVWSVNAGLPLASVQTLQDIYARSMARTSFALVMLAIAAAMALGLGLVGIYGVISYAVSQRTREIGIRLALGAQQGEVKRMFVRQALLLAGVGTAIGLAGAAGLTRLMSSLLFGVSARDPITYVMVPLVLVITAMLAAYLPARRAAAVDPAEALKVE